MQLGAYGNMLRLLSLPLTGLLLATCVTGAKLREDAKAIEVKLQSARERGAYRCAPAELARADANLEFMKYELTEGDFRRADWHRRAALENVERALEITNPDECADKRVLISEDRPIIITKTDRDGDGITDDVDQCPDEPGREPTGCPERDRDNDGIPDDIDRCPDIPEDLDGNEDEDGCPEEENTDSDGDGIFDKDDKCPNDPEDFDGFQDEDGCPEPDNDLDTVLDVVDACPLEAGSPTNNGCPITDRDSDGITDDVDQCPDVPGLAPTGCPKKVLVVKTDKAIEIKQQINFETNKATIKGALSFEILDQVAAVMKSNPDIQLIRIEGHTDSVGDAAKNLKLSDDRASSVREALIERGVDPARLQAIGYGESRPIASNKTKKGRAANRRVEFNIVTPGASAPEAPVP